MAADMQKARELFLHAVGKLPAEQWESYIAQACGGDVELRRQAEHLLEVHRKSGSFLEQPAAKLWEAEAFESAPAGAMTTDRPAEAPSPVIGPYKLLQQIGEGGMGAVWMAEQEHPVRRKVALKIIKPGMDSRQVIARFEAERQALALMDHLNIARVLDAGTTETGRPYFVMELIHGIPITKYCDGNHLTLRERLELFVPVCQAIQHAHQKGIIHRDVKPSNVLVTLYDGKPVPKVIDFGVAKAVEQRLTEQTLFTQYGAIIGTFEYMSPEQAEMSALGVDTRSDIFSLGVLLYELVTGTTPLERRRLQTASYEEIVRMIREEEPARPSTRLSHSKTLPAVAAARKMEAVKLTKLVRGELDWIVMKCLEKDRNRRYETATGLARDIERFLNDEPVQACPPSNWYRLRKIARRNKAALAIASSITAALLLGIIGLAIANYRIAQQRDLAQREHELAEVNLQKARMAVDDYLTTVSENTLLKSSLPGLQPLRKELLQTALRYYEGFVREHQEDPTLRFDLATATFRVGVITAEIDSHENGLKYLVHARELLGEMADADPSRLDYRRELGRCQVHIGYVTGFSRPLDAVPSYEQGINALEAVAPNNPTDDRLLSDLAFGHYHLSVALTYLGKYGEARQHTLRTIQLWQELSDRNRSEPRYRSELARSLTSLAYIQFHEHQLHEALENVQKSEAIEQALVREHPWDASVRRNLSLSLAGQGTILRSMGRQTESLARLREASEIMHKVSTDNPLDIDLQRQASRRFAEYAQTLVDANRLEPGEQALAGAQEHAEAVVKKNPKDFESQSALSSVHRNRGKILGKKNKPSEALRELLEAVVIDEQLAPIRAIGRYDLACSLALCCAMTGKMGVQDEAEHYAQRALTELRRAWEQGWKDIGGIDKDPDLDALRSQADFQAFMKSLPRNTSNAGR